jgi:hypothetical protein
MSAREHNTKAAHFSTARSPRSKSHGIRPPLEFLSASE